MSVYCGFATRHQESVYNTLLYKLIELLQEKAMQFISQENLFNEDKKWAKKILKIYRAQLYMERNKYLEPFFSQGLDNLVDLIKKIYTNMTNRGSISNFGMTDQSLSSNKQSSINNNQPNQNSNHKFPRSLLNLNNSYNSSNNNQEEDNRNQQSSLQKIKQERMQRMEDMRNMYNQQSHNNSINNSQIKEKDNYNNSIDRQSQQKLENIQEKPYSNISKTTIALSRIRQNSNEKQVLQLKKFKFHTNNATKSMSSSSGYRQKQYTQLKDYQNINSFKPLKYPLNSISSSHNSTFINQTLGRDEINNSIQSQYKTNNFNTNIKSNSISMKQPQSKFQHQGLNNNPQNYDMVIQQQTNKQIKNFTNRTITTIRSQTPSLIINKSVLKNDNSNKKRSYLNMSQFEQYSRPLNLNDKNLNNIIQFDKNLNSNNDMNEQIQQGNNNYYIKSKTPQQIKQIKFKTTQQNKSQSQSSYDITKTFQRVSFNRQAQNRAQSQLEHYDQEKENLEIIKPLTVNNKLKTKLPKSPMINNQRNVNLLSKQIHQNTNDDIISLQQKLEQQNDLINQSIDFDKQQVLELNNGNVNIEQYNNNVRISLKSEKVSQKEFQSFNNTDTAIIISNQITQTQQTTSSLCPLYDNNNNNKNNNSTFKQKYQQYQQQNTILHNDQEDNNGLDSLSKLKFTLLNEDSEIKQLYQKSQTTNKNSYTFLRPKAHSLIQPKNLTNQLNQSLLDDNNKKQKFIQIGQHKGSMKANQQDLFNLNQIMQQYSYHNNSNPIKFSHSNTNK